MLVEQVRSAALFSELTDEDVQQIVSKGDLIYKERGGWFCHQGDRARNFYLLKEGVGKVHQFTGQGDSLLVRVLAPLEIFGFRAVGRSGIQAMSVQAAKDCRCIAWPANRARELFHTFPQMAINAFLIAAEHIFEYETRVGDLTSDSLERRVARTLFDLSSRLGNRENGALVVDAGLLQKDIADLTGASVFSVSRLFAQWRRRRIAETARGRILIRDAAALKRIAETPASQVTGAAG